MESMQREHAPGRPGFGRRHALGIAGGFVGLLGAAGIAGAQTMPPQDAPAVPATDVLNFALNLEYLEAEYYQRGAFGRSLPPQLTDGQGTPGMVRGGDRVPFITSWVQQFMQEVADDEYDHVRFLRQALGTAAVARPEIDFVGAFTTAMQAAGVIGPGETFDPFANEGNFLLGAFLFEDVGVTAYKGAAPLLDDKGLLEAAAGILAIEAYHAGMIRTALFLRRQGEATIGIATARDTLDGPGNKDAGVVRFNADGAPHSNVVLEDENGLAYSRSPREVLNIVYLGGQAAGGFFPNGVNGAIA